MNFEILYMKLHRTTVTYANFDRNKINTFSPYIIQLNSINNVTC